MRLILALAGIMLTLVGKVALACDVSLNELHPVVVAPGGYIYFEEEPLTPEDGAVDYSDVGLAIYYYDCNAGASKFIDDLPYLAAPGKVHAAFFYRSEDVGKSKLAIIHGVEIRSDTGISYVGDYYSVHVFDVDGANYLRDDKAFRYFGYGGDIVNNYDDRVRIYRYPYKSEGDVRSEMDSMNFKRWMEGREVGFYLRSGIRLYKEPTVIDVDSEFTKSNIYVRQVGAQAGWLKVVGALDSKQNIAGWIQRDDLVATGVE